MSQVPTPQPVLTGDSASLATATPAAGQLVFESDTGYRKVGDGVTTAAALPPQTTRATAQAGTAYTLALADALTVVECTAAGAVVVTVPLNATVAFPIGTVISLYSAGAGGVTVTPDAGVTVRNNGAGFAQFASVTLRKRATDEWVRT